MLPEYIGVTLTAALLTDDIVNTALERCEYDGISTDTARNACYMWMSHAAVGDEELVRFGKEGGFAFDPSHDSFEALCAVEVLSVEIWDQIIAEETAKYRDAYVSADAVIKAMKQLGIETDVMAMRTLTAAYVVMGESALMKAYGSEMEQLSISIVDVFHVVHTLMSTR